MPAEQISKRLFNEPWAITSDWLQKMISIADRETDIVALEAKIGKKLEYSHTSTVRGNIAVIPIEGPIFPKANLFSRISGATSLEMIAQDMQSAIDNSQVKNIVIAANSPGGSIVGVDEMYTLISTSPKPVHLHIGGTGASALYWLGSGASSISLSPTSQVGSIGVVYITEKEDGESNTLEIISSASPRKRLNPETDEGRRAVQESVDKIAEVFISQVAAGRNVSTDVVKETFGKGGMLMGQDAVDAGMADNVLTFEELMASLSEQENNLYGENMTASELKEKHPDIYKAVFEAGVGSVKPSSSTEAEKEEKARLTAEVMELKEKLKTKDTDNAAIVARLNDLEKNDAIRRVAQAQAKAEAQAKAISEELLAESDIPTSLHGKVRSAVNMAEFFADDVLDADAFKLAMQAEVTDWSDRLKASAASLTGFGIAPEDGDSGSNAETDSAVDRLLAHIPSVAAA